MGSKIETVLSCLICISGGLLFLWFGFRARMRYRGRLSGRVQGRVVSSHYEVYTENQEKFYDMYATIDYKINDYLYQANFSFEHSKKYYHFLSHGNIVDMLYDPHIPEEVQIARLFRNAGGNRIKFGILLVFIGSFRLLYFCFNW